MPSPSTSPTQSLLRRLRSKTSQLSLRTPRRCLADFQIQLNDPHRVYSPTNLVPGSVCVTVERALAITHLTVSLVGFVDVHASARESGGRKYRKDSYGGGGGGGVGGGGGGGGGGDGGDCGGGTVEGFGALRICRDEIVLCGEGRLEPGVYRFGFELEFCKLPGIGGSLPTSLDFEKGSISYTVVATITRATSTSPTTSCSTKVAFMDTIDISRYPIPKPRVIRLEPVNRQSHRSSKKTQYPRSASAGSTPNSSLGNLHETLAEKSSTKAPITATVELLNAGALRGENIGVKISIQHTKKIKSINGIILTLMRQTRFDPAGDEISLDKLKIGIGTLPVASTFRKDLAQTICPLITDPFTLTAVVRTSLRVPEDVFPTITNVPGGAVEFRYWVEVVMDLGGKLNGRDDLFSVIPRVENDKSGAMSVVGGVMIETERVRGREKSVVSCKFEVIVGSVDTVGKKGRVSRSLELAPPPPPPPPPPHPTSHWPNEEPSDRKEPPSPHHPSEAGPPSAFESREDGDERDRRRQGLPEYRRSPVFEHHSDSGNDDDDKTERERRRLQAQESLPPGISEEEEEEEEERVTAGPSAPGLPEYRRSVTLEPDGDDKTEYERRRLQAQESLPPCAEEGPEDMAGVGPSAPILPEYLR